MKKINVAIDGYSSNGKSTMAKDLAKRINYIYIDTGAMYRALTLFCIQNHLFHKDGLDVKGLEKTIESIEVNFIQNPETGKPDIYLNGRNVEVEIRSMEVSRKVSIVSSVSIVRKKMVRLQQEMGKQKGVVMDGRDVGTVVLPDAELKIFLTASLDVRAKRRFDELRSKGDANTSLEEVLDNLKERDFLDENREEGPLRKAKDAIVLDNTYMTIPEQMEWLLNKFNEVANG